jgi:hypothetical protein
MGNGKPFKLFSDSTSPTIFQLSGFLNDSDSSSSDDDLLSFQTFSIRLEDLAGKGEMAFGFRDMVEMTSFVKTGIKLPSLLTSQGAARLYIRVERL